MYTHMYIHIIKNSYSFHTWQIFKNTKSTYNVLLKNNYCEIV